MKSVSPFRQSFVPIVLVVVIIGAVLFHRPRMLPMNERLVSSDHEVRNLALYSFVKQSDEEREKLVPDLILHLKDEAPLSRQFALYALRVIDNPTASILQAAEVALKDPDRKVRREAYHLILTALPEATPLVLNVYHEVTPSLRKRFVHSFKQIQVKSLPELIRTINEGTLRQKANAVRLVYEMEAKPPKINPSLEKMLTEENRDGVFYASLLLVNIGGDSSKILPVFKSWLTEKAWSGRHYKILDAIAMMGEQAKDLKPFIESQLRQRPDGFVEDIYPKPALAKILKAIDPRKTDDSGLMWDLKQQSPVKRYRAVWEISQMDKVNRGFVPHLVAVLDDVWLPTRARALFCLGKAKLDKSSRFKDRIIRSTKMGIQLNEKSNQVDGYKEMAGPILNPFGVYLTTAQ